MALIARPDYPQELLQQTHRAAEVFFRKGDGWAYGFLMGADAVLDMPEIGISVPLAEITATSC